MREGSVMPATPGDCSSLLLTMDATQRTDLPGRDPGRLARYFCWSRIGLSPLIDLAREASADHRTPVDEERQPLAANAFDIDYPPHHSPAGRQDTPERRPARGGGDVELCEQITRSVIPHSCLSTGRMEKTTTGRRS